MFQVMHARQGQGVGWIPALLVALSIFAAPAAAQPPPPVEIEIDFPFTGAEFSDGDFATIVKGRLTFEGQPVGGLYVTVDNVTTSTQFQVDCSGELGEFYLENISLVTGDNILRVIVSDATSRTLDCNCPASLTPPTAGYPVTMDVTVTVLSRTCEQLVQDTKDDVDALLEGGTFNQRDSKRLERASLDLDQAIANLIAPSPAESLKHLRGALKEMGKLQLLATAAARPRPGIT